MGDQHRVAEAGGDRGGGMPGVDHERAAADRGAVDPFRGEPEIVRDRGRGLAGGGDAVDVRRLEPGIGHRVQRGVGVELDLRGVGDDAELGRLGGADDGDRFRLHRGLPRGRAEEGEGDVVVELLKRDFDRHVELQRLGRLRAARDVGHHAAAPRPVRRRRSHRAG